jgi:hypothetical protein
MIWWAIVAEQTTLEDAPQIKTRIGKIKKTVTLASAKAYNDSDRAIIRSDYL